MRVPGSSFYKACVVFLILLATMRLPVVRAQLSGDVRRLLGTKTSYAHRLPIPGSPSIYTTPDPPGYTAHAMWLLSRHGTRWPTSDRMKEIDSLEPLFQSARNKQQFPWMANWTSPTRELQYAAGELHPIGEEELWSLAVRLRTRFPNLLRSSYLPRRFPIQSTQVPRAAASASAFAAGFFPPVPASELGEQFISAGSAPHNTHSAATVLGTPEDALRRTLMAAFSTSESPRHKGPPNSAFLHAPGDVPARFRHRPQPVAINMLPKASDPLLRFYDMCPEYAQREEYLGMWLGAWLADGWAELAPVVSERLGAAAPLGPCDVRALWTLCQFEAGLQGVTNRACALFSPSEVSRLEWWDDVDLLESHGWGSPVNYAIAAPLLQDLRHSLQAVAAKAQHHMHARLLFGHCETLVPLATLLGLFRPELGPTPQDVQLPRKSVLDAAAPADGAQRLVTQADTLEDLHTHTQPHSHASRDAATPVGEGVDACVGGVTPQPAEPIPKGWFPMTPYNDTRIFRGGRVSPYGANMQVVLYTTSHHLDTTVAGHGKRRSKFRVRLLYNEQLVPIPGCKPIGPATEDDPGAPYDCDLDTFLGATEALAGNASTLSRWCTAAPAS